MIQPITPYRRVLLLAAVLQASAAHSLPEPRTPDAAGSARPPVAERRVPPAPSAGPALPARATFAELTQVQPGDLQVLRWDHVPQAFVFVYPDLATQARALNRIAAFVEKAHAPRDRVLTDEELAATIQASGAAAATYYVGHNYPAAALAAFFTAARRSNVPLDPLEHDLRSRLARYGFFTETKHGQLTAREPERILLSVAPEPAPWLSARDQRLKLASLLRHELSHAEFFANPAYRAYCLRFWRALPDDQRRIFTEEFTEMGYDPAQVLLLANEFQAFLWEPLRGAFIEARLRRQGGGLARLRAAFLAPLAAGQPPITTLFALPGFAEPIVWDESTPLVKTSEPIP